MKKDDVIKILDEFPNEFEVANLIESLIVIDKIDAGLKDVQQNEIISHDEMKKEISRWLK